MIITLATWTNQNSLRKGTGSFNIPSVLPFSLLTCCLVLGWTAAGLPRLLDNASDPLDIWSLRNHWIWLTSVWVLDGVWRPGMECTICCWDVHVGAWLWCSRIDGRLQVYCGMESTTGGHLRDGLRVMVHWCMGGDNWGNCAANWQAETWLWCSCGWWMTVVVYLAGGHYWQTLQGWLGSNDSSALGKAAVEGAVLTTDCMDRCPSRCRCKATGETIMAFPWCDCSTTADFCMVGCVSSEPCLMASGVCIGGGTRSVEDFCRGVDMDCGPGMGLRNDVPLALWGCGVWICDNPG